MNPGRIIPWEPAHPGAMDPGLYEDGPCPSSGCLEGPLACESSVESPATGAKQRKVLITPEQFRDAFGEDYNTL